MLHNRKNVKKYSTIVLFISMGEVLSHIIQEPVAVATEQKE